MASCTCDLFNFLLLRQQSDYVLKFLVGLSDSYGLVRSQLLLAVPLPSMAKVFSLLLQEESQRQLTNFTSNDTHALLAKHYTQPNQNKQSKFIKDKLKKSSLHCTHCGYNGHTIDKCFQLHGYPPGWTGPKGKRNLPSAHAAISTEEVFIKNSNESQRFSLTAEEFNKLIALANSSSTTQNIDTSTAAVNLATTQFSGNLFSQCNYVSTKLNSEFSWILDTSATNHMICSHLLYSSTPKPVTNSINLPNGQTVPALYIGTVSLSSTLHLHNVLCVPNFSFNLLSVSKLTKESNLCLSFFDSHCLLQDQSMKKMIGIAYEKQGLYYLPQASSKANSCQHNQFNPTPISASIITRNQPNLWHYRLGHVSNSRIPFLRQIDNSITFDCTNVCEICPLAKQKKLSFPVSQSISNKEFELIHCDIWGPFATISYSGFKFFLTIVDDFTRCTWVYMLKTKSEVSSLLPNFCNMVKTQFNTSVKTIRTDNGSEFFLTKFYGDNGIVHQRSCVETPQQNGVVERKHQHLLNTARALMFQANLPLIFWSDCVLTAAHIINRIPTPLLQNKTPFEMLFHKSPNLSHLKIFGKKQNRVYNKSFSYLTILCI